MFPVEVEPDRGPVFVQVPLLRTAEGSVRATTCTLTSVTASHAPVSYLLFDFFFHLYIKLFHTVNLFFTSFHSQWQLGSMGQLGQL